MVSERSLYRLSLLLSVAGIISLFFIVQAMEPAEAAISEISGDFLGRTVSVSGIIKDKPYWHEDGHLFFTLSDSEGNAIKTVFFEREAKKLPALKNISRGMNVTVTGKVNEYQNELEIVGTSLG